MTKAPTSQPGPRKDPLSDAKVANGGDAPLDPATVRNMVVERVAAARELLPDGLPKESPLGSLNRDQLIQLSNQYDLGALSSILKEDELALCIEAERMRRIKAAHASNGTGKAPPPPTNPAVPAPEPDRKPKIRGLKESPNGRYRVTEPKRAAMGGQIFQLEKGAVIEVRHYGPAGLQTLIDQGVKLEPDPDEPEE